MIKKYVKKLIPIEVMQWDGSLPSADRILKWMREHGVNGEFSFAADSVEGGVLIQGHKYLEIETLEGDMRALPGDYIIKGIRDEFYPCKEKIFEESYEEYVD